MIKKQEEFNLARTPAEMQINELVRKINEIIEATNPILKERESGATGCEEEIEFQKSQFVWHLLELVEMTSVKLQDRISKLIKEYDCIFSDNKQKGE